MSDNDKYICRFKYNKELADERDLDDGTRHELELQYIVMSVLFDEASVTKEHGRLKEINRLVEKCETKLQELWGFDPDPSRFSYWYEIPGCVCPKLDNEDLLGISTNIYNTECPIHQPELVNADT